MATIALVAYLLFLPLQSRPDVATFLLIALGLFALLGRQRVTPAFQKSDFLVLGLAVVALCLSTALSADTGVSLRYLGYAAINGFVLLLAATQRHEWQWRALAACLALVGAVHIGVLAVYGGVPASINAQSIIDAQPLVSLRVPNDALISGLCLPALAFVLFAPGRLNPWLSVPLLVAYVGAGFYCSYLLDSKVVLLSLVGSLFAVVFLGWKGNPGFRPGARVVVFVALCVGLFALAWAYGNNSTTRLGIWSEAFSNTDTVKEVLVGSGPNTFEYDPARAEHSFDEEGRIVPWTHNLFIEAFAEQGVLGLCAILALVLVPLWRGLTLADDRRRVFVLASVLVFCLVALVELTLTRRFNFAFLCLLYGLTCSGVRAHRLAETPGQNQLHGDARGVAG